MKNENKGDEMKDILEHLQQYVPSASFRKTIGYGSGRTLEITDNTFRKVSFLYSKIYTQLLFTLHNRFSLVVISSLPLV